jgi:TetR/AcrR family transcriptional regulator, mexCD-oprJ operon repressor
VTFVTAPADPRGGDRSTARPSGAEAGRRGQRADARRNVAAILDAAKDCLVRDPDATVAEIAKRAGVGRVTLYGHFPTRAELVDAVFARVSAEAEKILSAVDTDGDPVAALARLVSSTWQVVHSSRAVLAAAQRELPAERIRGHHDSHLARVTALIRRGRSTGVFRTDVPEQWLVTTGYTLMHAAADEASAGRLDAASAGKALVATLVAAYTPVGRRVKAAPPVN